jgi:hypothetical protein
VLVLASTVTQMALEGTERSVYGAKQGGMRTLRGLGYSLEAGAGGCEGAVNVVVGVGG